MRCCPSPTPPQPGRRSGDHGVEVADVLAQGILGLALYCPTLLPEMLDELPLDGQDSVPFSPSLPAFRVDVKDSLPGGQQHRETAS